MALARTLVRGALSSPFKRPGRPGRPAVALPEHRATASAVRVDPARLAAYARLCGFPASPTGALPLPYPHVLSFPLVMRILAARDFPLPLLGLVHTWIDVRARRALHRTDSPELMAYATALTPHRRGTEVTVVTEARLDGALAWVARNRYLCRHRTAPERSGAPADHAVGAPGYLPERAEWQLPAGLGRRYGAVSGDRNPIHLHPLAARAFGFRTAIAHGMWSFARCLAEAVPDPYALTYARAEFRAPVPLPGTVTYAAAPADPHGTAFQLRRGARIHLVGATESVTAADTGVSEGTSAPPP
ncbi:MaoC/PaaZ C-terminal domain-containing protein [Streptomyces sp. NPDC048057]|uniref:MaoC family dehydratase n=1 Tax=Streptomyces sp. NPDC048057 TaxID=3155628 RepID=UPI0033E2F87E